MRKPFLDNIRWAVVLLVIFYHVFFEFNSVGVLGAIGGFTFPQYQDGILYFIYPWFMILLFLVSGICSRYSMEKYSSKEFLKMRVRTLIVPGILGVFVYQWIVGYITTKASGPDAQKVLETVPLVAKYIICSLGGIGPLWFAHLLMILCLFVPLFKVIDKNNRFYEICGKANLIVLFALAVPLWGCSYILNTPVITVYRFGIYGFAFFAGYFVFAHEQIQEKLEKIACPLLIIAVLCGIGYSIYFFGQPYADDKVLTHPLTNLYAWIMCLAVLGSAKKWFNFQNKFTVYMSQNSFGYYVLHMLWIILPAYLLKNFTDLPVWCIYVLTGLSGFIMTSAEVFVMKRIPVLRYCVLGIKKKKE